MLFLLVFLPLLGGLAAWLFEAYLQRSFTRTGQCKLDYNKRYHILIKFRSDLCRYSASWVALLTMVLTLVIIGILGLYALAAFYQGQEWLMSIDVPWIPLLGIRFHLILDGLSVLMSLLVIVVVIIAILYSRKDAPKSSGLFYLCLLFMTSAVIMSFMAMDLFLWFFLWEAIAIPVYFLITLWGRRDTNAQLTINGVSKFLIYTQVSSLLMLLAIISLALTNWQLTNQWTFDYLVLTKTPISSYVEFMLMLGFLAAFIVRIPLVPFHSWFIDAHIESSTTGSIMISGLLVNTAIYGLLRFVIPLFPNASLTISPLMWGLSLLTLFYCGLLCFSQSDIKRLVAYAHVALMSFMVAIVYSASLLAYQSIVLQIIAVSLVAVGLFIISGLLVERYSTRNISQFLGLKAHVKYLSTLTLFFILAVIGVPGTANFVGNFMALMGSYSSTAYGTILLIVGLLLLSISIVIRIHPIFYGIAENVSLDKKAIAPKDLGLLIAILMMLFFIGLYPQWILDMSYPVINKLYNIISSAQTNLIEGDV